MPLSEILSMGLIAGLAPSPHSLLLAWTQAETPKSGTSREALLKVLAGGMVSDVFIILSVILISKPITLLLSSTLFSFAGLFFTGWIAFKLFGSRPRRPSLSESPSVKNFFLKGLSIQLVNPNPYFFWGTLFFPLTAHVSVLGSVSLGVLFMITVYGVKWLVYGEGIRGFLLSGEQRLCLARAAFLVFLGTTVLKTIG